MAKIKICGLSRKEDIAAVNEARSDYCGFIIDFPKSHRNVTRERVKELTEALDSSIIRVGVVVDQPVERTAALLNEDIVDILQLHGNEDENYIVNLRRLVPENAEIWKAFKIRNTQDLAAAANSTADRVVLDNGYGTGQVFDWSLMENIEFHRPYILAGGLTPENIPEAIAWLHPWGIDISSGVETAKKKDREKICAAVAAVRRIQDEDNL